MLYSAFMMKRYLLMKKLATVFPKMWMRPGEEFSINYKGTIWTGEGSYDNEGSSLFDRYVYNEDPHEVLYTMGIRNTLRTILDEAGWYCEWYDAGTVFIFPK